MTTTLNNGEEMMLVEVPDGKIHWSKLSSDPDTIGWELIKIDYELLLNFHGNMGLVCNVPLGKETDIISILGTYYKGEIDFEVNPYWVESSGEFNSMTGYLHQFKDYVMGEFELDARTSFLSLLQSLTEPNKKYVILIETKK